jgi:formylglycine-generating enzyme required for sulfatase activity
MPKLIIGLLLLSLTQTLSATAQLTFEGLKPKYEVGEFIIFDLQENLKTASRFEKVDLWIAVELPSRDLLFRTPQAFNSFSPIPQAFRTALDTTNNRHRVLEFEVQPGYGGDYTFYAVYVVEGKNPMTDNFPVFRSNVAAASTTLSNRVLPGASGPEPTAPTPPPATSPPAPAETKLPAPNPFTAVVGDSQITLSWQPVSGAASYTLDWQAPDGSDRNLSLSSTSYQHSGLINGATYTYWISGVSVTGLEGHPSEAVVATPKAAERPPAAPAHLSAEAADSQVVLNWPAVSGAVSYKLNWQIAGGAVQSVPATTTAYVHTGLQNNLNYTYWVTAVSASGLASAPSITVVATPKAAPPPVARLADGESFRDTLKDGSLGPEMVVIPAGTFRMGDIQGGGWDNELPVHQVSVGRFAMGKYEVTFAEYDKFAEATGRSKPDDYGWGRGNRPVINVSWHDATAYLDWLSEQTGKRYRLPTEAEWEYAARAGTETKYWWGNDIGTNLANCRNSGSEWSGKQTAPVGSFQANPFGLYDTVGNLWEWCADPWHSNYQGAPTDGRIWDSTDTTLRLLRGGSFDIYPLICRAALRFGYASDFHNWDVGFRGCADLAL